MNKICFDEDLSKYDGLHCSLKVAAYLKRHPKTFNALIKLSPTKNVFPSSIWSDSHAYILKDGNIEQTIILEWDDQDGVSQ